MATTLDNFTLAIGQLTDSEVALVSTTSSEKKFLGAIQLFNSSTLPVEVTFWLLGTSTTGTTGSGGNESWFGTIPARGSVKILDFSGQVVDNSMKFSGKGSTTSVINIRISGTTET